MDHCFKVSKFIEAVNILVLYKINYFVNFLKKCPILPNFYSIYDLNSLRIPSIFIHNLAFKIKDSLVTDARICYFHSMLTTLFFHIQHPFHCTSLHSQL